MRHGGAQTASIIYGKPVFSNDRPSLATDFVPFTRGSMGLPDLSSPDITRGYGGGGGRQTCLCGPGTTCDKTTGKCVPVGGGGGGGTGGGGKGKGKGGGGGGSGHGGGGGGGGRLLGGGTSIGGLAPPQVPAIPPTAPTAATNPVLIIVVVAGAGFGIWWWVKHHKKKGTQPSPPAGEEEA